MPTPAVPPTPDGVTGLIQYHRLTLLAVLVRDGVLSAPTAERAALAILGLDPALAAGPAAVPTGRPAPAPEISEVTGRCVLLSLLSAPMPGGMMTVADALRSGSDAVIGELYQHGLHVGPGPFISIDLEVCQAELGLKFGPDAKDQLLSLPGAFASWIKGAFPSRAIVELPSKLVVDLCAQVDVVRRFEPAAARSA